MKTALWELQTAIHQRLSTDAALSHVKVYDAVESDAIFPHITLGDDTVNDWGDKLEPGEDITHTLHVWSRYKGKKEAKEILSLVLESLTSAPLSLGSGFSLCYARREFMEVITDIDGITRHGVLRLRFNISQEE